MPELHAGGRDLGSSSWCVVHSQPHRELRAANHLTAQGFRAFVPLHRKTIRHARQFRSVLAPLFPRYLFVSLAPTEGRWTSIRGTFGVSHLIMDGERPRSVPAGVVEELLLETDDRGIVNLESSLTPGDTVRITTGAFAGLVGTLASLDSNGRVKVLLDILGKDVVARGKLGLVPAA